MAEIQNLLFAYAAFEKCASVDARGGVSLKIDHVTRLVTIAGMKEVIKANFEQRGERRVG